MGEHKRRQYIPVGSKRTAWRRARGRCEECRKQLFERTVVRMPSEAISFLVRLWHGHECWRCHASGRVLLVFDSQGYGYSYIQWDELGEAVRAKYPFFRRGYSATMEMNYYTNHCENCGALQGHHYVRLWAMGESLEGSALEPITGVMDYSPPASYPTTRFLPFQVHHVDGNPSNNCVDNLKVVCVDCHRRIHSTTRHIVQAVR